VTGAGRVPFRRHFGPVARALLVVAATPLVAGFFFESLLAPDAKLWPRWQAHRAGSAEIIDHRPWDAFLARYVADGGDGINRVAYGRVGAADRRALEAYIGRLAALPISRYGRPQQKAYWINLYNALTVRVVLDHFPVAGIRDVDLAAGLFADGPWRKKLLTIEGEAVGLDDIEHRILRPIWRDPRLHYALNCAAMGCPNLQGRAFTAGNTETLLEAAARAYVNHSRGVRFAGGGLHVSSIYVWFREDFGDSDGGVIRHLKRYAEPDLASRLDGFTEIGSHAYDWALNGAAP
jgi:hypothetical protein